VNASVDDRERSSRCAVGDVRRAGVASRSPALPPGALYLDGQQRLLGVLALDIAGGQITSISSIVNLGQVKSSQEWVRIWLLGGLAMCLSDSSGVATGS
jgi:hypothetical protein